MPWIAIRIKNLDRLFGWIPKTPDLGQPPRSAFRKSRRLFTCELLRLDETLLIVIMNVNKKLGRFKQWAGERMGGEVKTSVSDDFKSLEIEMGLRQEGKTQLGS